MKSTTWLLNYWHNARFVHETLANSNYPRQLASVRSWGPREEEQSDSPRLTFIWTSRVMLHQSSNLHGDSLWMFMFLGRGFFSPRILWQQRCVFASAQHTEYFFFFFSNWSPSCTLASSRIALYWYRSCDFRLQSLKPVVFRSFSTESILLVWSLRTKYFIIASY
jgi:hypothetical protein